MARTPCPQNSGVSSHEISHSHLIDDATVCWSTFFRLESLYEDQGQPESPCPSLDRDLAPLFGCSSNASCHSSKDRRVERKQRPPVEPPGEALGNKSGCLD